MAIDLVTELETTVQRIVERGEDVTPLAIVKEAEASDGLLHDHFEWDDGIAAHQYRLGQAARLMRIIEVPTTTRRGWVSVSRGEHNDRVYKPVEEIKEDPATRISLLEDVKKTLMGYRRNFGWLRELDPVWKAIDYVSPQAKVSKP